MIVLSGIFILQIIGGRGIGIPHLPIKIVNLIIKYKDD